MIQAAHRAAPAFVLAVAAGTTLAAPILYNTQDRSILTEVELFGTGTDDMWDFAPDNSPFIAIASAQVTDVGETAFAVATQASFLGNTSIIASGSSTGIVNGEGSALANSEFVVSFDITQASIYSVSVAIARSTYLIEGPSLTASTTDGSFTDILTLEPGTYRVSFSSHIIGSRNQPGASSWAFSLIEVPTPGAYAILGIAGICLLRRRR